MQVPVQAARLEDIGLFVHGRTHAFASQTTASTAPTHDQGGAGPSGLPPDATPYVTFQGEDTPLGSPQAVRWQQQPEQPPPDEQEMAKRRKRRENWQKDKAVKLRWDLKRRLVDISADVEFVAREVGAVLSRAQRVCQHMRRSVILSLPCAGAAHPDRVAVDPDPILGTGAVSRGACAAAAEPPASPGRHCAAAVFQRAQGAHEPQGACSDFTESCHAFRQWHSGCPTLTTLHVGHCRTVGHTRRSFSDVRAEPLVRSGAGCSTCRWTPRPSATT